MNWIPFLDSESVTVLSLDAGDDVNQTNINHHRTLEMSSHFWLRLKVQPRFFSSPEEPTVTPVNNDGLLYGG